MTVQESSRLEASSPAKTLKMSSLNPCLQGAYNLIGENILERSSLKQSTVKDVKES